MLYRFLKYTGADFSPYERYVNTRFPKYKQHLNRTFTLSEGQTMNEEGGSVDRRIRNDEGEAKATRAKEGRDDKGVEGQACVET